MKSAFLKGLSHGLPIALGYLSVSVGFGILATGLDVSVLGAVLISLTNLTSAGQAAGVAVIGAGGTFLEMALTQFVINLRYALMGLSLTQKIDSSFNTPKRLLLSFGITDEIYAVAISQKGTISASYMAGLIILPIIGWTSGTLFGALAGHLLPKVIAEAMGIMLYGMFIAVFIPASRKERNVLAVICIAIVCSIIFKYLLTFVSGGFAIILSAVIAAALGALLFPKKEEEEEAL